LGKGAPKWQIGGAAVLTGQDLIDNAKLSCSPPPPAGTGLGCTKIQLIVVGKAQKATVDGEAPLLSNLIAVTNCGGMVTVAGSAQSKVSTVGAGTNEAPAESPPIHQPRKLKRGKLSFSLKDDEGKPLPGEWYRVTTPDGAVAYGLLDADGKADVTGLDQGAECKLEFPRLSYVAWSVATEKTGATKPVTTQDATSFQSVAEAHGITNPRRLWDHHANAKLRANREQFDRIDKGKEIHVPRRERSVTADREIHECRLEQPHPANSIVFRFFDATTGEIKKRLAVKLHGPRGEVVNCMTDDHGQVVARGDPKVAAQGRQAEKFAVSLADQSVAGLCRPDDFAGPGMRGLNEVLTETLIGATHDPAGGESFARHSGVPTFAPAAARTDPAIADIEKRPIWHMTIPNGAFDRITNLTCAVHDGHHPSTVCESVSWSSFVVKIAEGEIELPLSEMYRVQTRTLVGGERRSNHPTWPLFAQNDIALEHVFAYDVEPGRKCQPIPDSMIMSDRFMARSVVEKVEGRIGDPSIDVPVTGMRIVTVVGVACNKARADFDPGNLLLSARLYPTAMFLSSLPVTEAKATIRLARPPEQPAHGKDMSPYLRSGIFSDNNNPTTPRNNAVTRFLESLAETTRSPAAMLTSFFVSRLAREAPELPIPPHWDNIFAYYQADIREGEYVVIRPRLEECSRANQNTIHPALKKWASSLHKVAGQGAYDNVHIAPTMFLDPAPDITPEKYNDEMRDKFHDIVMAPFCIHDCLHIHWRWSLSNRTKQNLGWSAKGVPYSQEGAPMVHPNQTVRIKIKDTALDYMVNVMEPRSGEWQILMHHGCGYAMGLSKGWIDWTLRNGLKQIDLSDTRFWAVVYWFLRYGISPTVPDATRLLKHWKAFERNEIAADTKLRELAEQG
jgi:hypothetical protein